MHNNQNKSFENYTPRFCGKCGAQIVEDTDFCVYCGAPIRRNENTVNDRTGHKQKSKSSEEKNKKTSSPKQKHRGLVVVFIVICVLMIFAVGGVAVYYQTHLAQPETNVEQQHSQQGSEEVAEESAAVSISSTRSTGESRSAELPDEIAEALQDASHEIEQQNYASAFVLLNDLNDNNDYPEVTEMMNLCEYEWACYSMSEGNYTDAQQRFEKLGDYQDASDKAEECIYLYGKDCMDQENYYDAYITLSEMQDYSDISEILPQLKADLYNQAVEIYEKGVELEQKEYEELVQLDITDPDVFKRVSSFAESNGGTEYFEEANKAFELLGSYERSSDYRILNEARGNKISRTEADYIRSIMPFEDSCIVAMITPSSYRFFMGSWESANQEYFIRAYDDSSVCCNVPGYSFVKVDQLLCGVFCTGTQDDHITEICRVKIMDSNTLTIYCTSDGSEYTMYHTSVIY